jgi:hypothetical protein
MQSAVKLGPFANRGGVLSAEPSALELCAFGAAYTCDAAQWDFALHGKPIAPAAPCPFNNDIPLGMPLGPVPRWKRTTNPADGSSNPW